MSQAITIPLNSLPSAVDSSPTPKPAIAGGATESTAAIQNPLWAIVIGTGIFFAVAALMIASD
jgi:hypothetical protein